MTFKWDFIRTLPTLTKERLLFSCPQFPAFRRAKWRYGYRRGVRGGIDELCDDHLQIMATVDIGTPLLDRIKKFRLAKHSQGNAALIVKIDKARLDMDVEDELSDVTIDELREGTNEVGIVFHVTRHVNWNAFVFESAPY